MKNIIALCSADWHFHNWKQFNEKLHRTYVTIGFMHHLFLRAQKLKVPIWFLGDLFHTPKGLTTKVITLFNYIMKGYIHEFDDVRVLGISGNHHIDQGESLYNFSYNALNIDLAYRWRFALGSELALCGNYL